jgi:hypothetical protein
MFAIVACGIRLNADYKTGGWRHPSVLVIYLPPADTKIVWLPHRNIDGVPLLAAKKWATMIVQVTLLASRE